MKPSKSAGENGLSGLTELIEQDFVASKIPLPKTKPGNTNKAAAKRKAPAVSSVDVRTVKTTASGKVYGSENADARLVLKARSDVWIRIEDRQGNVVMTQTLRKGDTYRVPNRQGLIVIARDGGMISYAIDGVDKGSLGNQGEILVGRSLDLAALKNQRG